MGLFKSVKRAVKKVTKPVAKVLDKVIPNEIKPALPYLAAFAPYMLPAGAGAGLASIGINNPMLQRAILTGGINLGSQLAQEGSEGDFSALSLGLAGLQGALTAPNAAADLRTMANPGADVVGAGADAAEFATDQTLLGGLKESGLNLAATGAEKLSGIQNVLSDPNKLLSMEGLKASAIPVIQGTSDLALADARRALKAYEDELAAFNLEAGEASAASNAARRNAIIAAMTGNHAEDVIEATLAELGLKEGGIVSLNMGGSVLPSGTEMDYRGGGMIPMGSKERADDVPARLSKNEFVMTADAVRAAGGGSVNEGAKRMYNLMHNLEARV
tara:strand:+ start:471 stop:1463 length:993 start_codon:yes stop_codon:yes gene_type:complete